MLREVNATCVHGMSTPGGSVCDHLACQLSAELKPNGVHLTASHAEGHANDGNAPNDEGHMCAQRQHDSHAESHDHVMPEPVAAGQQDTASNPHVFQRGAHVESHDHAMPKPVAVGQQDAASVPYVFQDDFRVEFHERAVPRPVAVGQQVTASVPHVFQEDSRVEFNDHATVAVGQQDTASVPHVLGEFPTHSALRPFEESHKTAARCDQGQPETNPAMCDNSQVDKQVTLVDSLSQDGPLFVEICAGSAILSDTARRRGFAVMPIDCERNRHLPKCKIYAIDITAPHAQSLLSYVLQNCRVAFVHMAPPCGTCSRARGIPLPDGSSGPPVLRTAVHPWGLPEVVGVDRVKLDASNAVYSALAECVDLCEDLGVPWCIENPTNSWLWELPCFGRALALGCFAHCQACAYGSTRDKNTSFLCSFEGISHMARMCPGCERHEPWGFNANSETFHTRDEAAYPRAMCEAICDVAEASLGARGMSMSNSRPSVARAMKQERGRLHPQVVSEYSHVVSYLLPGMPPLDSKQCVCQTIRAAPKGSKLLRSEVSFVCSGFSANLLNLSRWPSRCGTHSTQWCSCQTSS